MAPPLVEVAGLRYHYPESASPALDDVSLELDGGLCAVAGPSGGGKSTLLRLFNGLVPHLYGGRISGSALVGGRDVLRTPTRLLATTVGFVVQDAERQAVHTTVERDIAFGLENLNTPRAEMRTRVAEVLERLAIGPLRERTIASLSGGERQRVALAGALVLRPRLLVLDEPLAQLDAAGAEAVLTLCAELRGAGTTIVVSEHRLDELLPVADSMLTIADGRCSGPGAPALLAAGLDSAPQIVRLSVVMGWQPVLLDPRHADLHVTASLPSAPAQLTAGVAASGAAPAGPARWSLDGVALARSGVSGVELEGRGGEVVALMGANGSGKTTLLRAIAGLAAPRAGSAWRSGRVAYLPQNPASLLHRESVSAEVAWTLRGRPVDGVAGLLDILGLSEVAHRDPRDLSSGQRQRAALAAVLAGRPEILLLDEPTRGMDGAARAGLIAAVRQAAAAGTAVVIATHDAELAALVADRVAVITDGAVRDRGAPSAALSGPDEPSTQLGRRLTSPGPVTVEAVAAALRAQTQQTAPVR